LWSSATGYATAICRVAGDLPIAFRRYATANVGYEIAGRGVHTSVRVIGGFGVRWPHSKLQRSAPTPRRHCFRLRHGQEIFAGVDEAVGFEVELFVVELFVAAVLGEELGVGAAFDDLAFFDDEDLVGAADRGEAVGDDECRAAAAEGGQAGLD